MKKGEKKTWKRQEKVDTVQTDTWLTPTTNTWPFLQPRSDSSRQQPVSRADQSAPKPSSPPSSLLNHLQDPAWMWDPASSPSFPLRHRNPGRERERNAAPHLLHIAIWKALQLFRSLASQFLYPAAQYHSVAVSLCVDRAAEARRGQGHRAGTAAASSHSARPGQAGELGREEPDEVQQGQGQGPAPGEEQPQAPGQAGADLLGSSSAERDWECWGTTG